MQIYVCIWLKFHSTYIPANSHNKLLRYDTQPSSEIFPNFTLVFRNFTQYFDKFHVTHLQILLKIFLKFPEKFSKIFLNVFSNLQRLPKITPILALKFTEQTSWKLRSILVNERNHFTISWVCVWKILVKNFTLGISTTI